MDMKMRAEQITASENPVWDVKVINGIVPILSGKEERLQTATLAGFIELGTILQLPAVGVNWLGFLTGSVTFGELDTGIRQSIQDAGVGEFSPDYDLVNDTLVMTINAGVSE